MPEQTPVPTDDGETDDGNGEGTPSLSPPTPAPNDDVEGNLAFTDGTTDCGSEGRESVS